MTARRNVASISDLHSLLGYEKPKHPLITLVDLTKIPQQETKNKVSASFEFYAIMCKRFDGVLHYGRGSYDFKEGSLLFTAPNQLISTSSDLQISEGWALYFHPDLIYATDLGRKIHTYSFFNYDTNEALHISEEEKQIVNDCIQKIEREYSQNIDKHSQDLIVSNLELLLNYCNRFYDRQFYTRTKVNSDVVAKFENLLSEYFSQNLVEKGVPTVSYFASKLNISSNYLSDLLNRFTGKTTQEHIHLQIVEKAKLELWNSEKSISEIAYELGFEYPSHFTKIFKTKTGKSPSKFRQLN
ncbi:MAG: helix-turn-helix domain-containing protein [Cyclobacteriaceae bacterium]